MSRQYLYTLFLDELVRANAEALAGDTPAELLAEQTKKRIAALQHQITANDTDIQR